MISSENNNLRSFQSAAKHNIFEYMRSCRSGSANTGQSTSDVTIQCSDGAVRAHQLVLASISPMLCQELCWNQSNVDEARTIIMPEITIDKMSKYLEAVYSCEDLFSFQDINTIIGFKFASGDTGDRLHNTTSTPVGDEGPHHAANFVDTDMKEEADSEEESFVGTIMPSIKRYKSDTFVGEEKHAEAVILSHGKCKVNKRVSGHDKEEPGIHEKCPIIVEAAGPKKREYGRRSKVWQHFSVDPSDPTQCVCQICEGTIAYRSGGYGYTSGGGQSIFSTASNIHFIYISRHVTPPPDPALDQCCRQAEEES